jgi:hypothetical protein
MAGYLIFRFDAIGWRPLDLDIKLDMEIGYKYAYRTYGALLYYVYLAITTVTAGETFRYIWQI